MQVRSAADAAKKWSARAKNAAPDYKSGVAAAGDKWKKGVGNSEEAWKAGVQDAVNRGTFKKAVDRTDAATYTNNAVKLGADRFQSGVENAQPAMENGVRPYLEALSGADLPLKGSRRSGNNIARVQYVNDLMRKKRQELLGLNG